MLHFFHRIMKSLISILYGSPVFSGGWWKVECCMLEPGNNGSMWHFFLCVKDKNAKAVRREACYTFPVLERKGDRQPLAGGGK